MPLSFQLAAYVAIVMPFTREFGMLCTECGADITAQRNGKSKRAGLCTRCGRKIRISGYFRSYYAANRDRILAKNQKWARDNGERVVELRRLRSERRPKVVREPKFCIDCGTLVIRAERCRRCYVRNRYATDSDYRARRQASTRRWLQRKRSAAIATAGDAGGVRGMAAS